MANLFYGLRRINGAFRESVVGTFIRNVRPTVSTRRPSRAEQNDQTVAIAVPVVLISVAIIVVLVVVFSIWRKKRKGKKVDDETTESAYPIDPEKGRATFVSEDLNADKKEYLKELLLFKLSDPDSLEEEFKTLKWGLQYPCLAAMSSTNKEKNKYNGIIPYDHSRVILTNGTGDDYYNASYIDGTHMKKQYIAAQAPLEHTVDDFWRMVYDQRCTTIVMLTNLKENNKIKCDKYWPSESVSTYGTFEVTMVNERVKRTHCVREIEMQNLRDGQYFNVTQFHYTVWCDHKVPDTLEFVEFWDDVHKHEEQLAESAGKYGPLLVHCSAGIGRTGVFITFDRQIQHAIKTGDLDVFSCVQDMREQRVNMVQTKEQYQFVHEAVLKALDTLDGENGEQSIC